jgi:hypothetical protein
VAGENSAPSGALSVLRVHVAELFVTRLRVLACVIVDAAFLVAVAAINLGASKVLLDMHLQGTDQIVARTLQWMFVLATLGITLSFLVRDLVSAFARGVTDHD